jgi:hypothetical protein
MAADTSLDGKGHLQEALEARGGVLGALAVVAVREQQRDARLPEPLRLARADELMNQHQTTHPPCS